MLDSFVQYIKTNLREHEQIKGGVPKIQITKDPEQSKQLDKVREGISEDKVTEDPEAITDHRNTRPITHNRSCPLKCLSKMECLSSSRLCQDNKEHCKNKQTCCNNCRVGLSGPLTRICLRKAGCYNRNYWR